MLVARLQSIGNFREFPVKHFTANSSTPTTNTTEAMLTFVVQDNEAKSIRVAAFNDEAYKYEGALKVNKQ